VIEAGIQGILYIIPFSRILDARYEHAGMTIFENIRPRQFPAISTHSRYTLNIFLMREMRGEELLAEGCGRDRNVFHI
jgi:hypothetical protein